MTPLLWVVTASFYSFVALGFYALVIGGVEEKTPGTKLFMFIFAWMWPFLLSIAGIVFICVSILGVWRRKRGLTSSLFSNNGRG